MRVRIEDGNEMNVLEVESKDDVADLFRKAIQDSDVDFVAFEVRRNWREEANRRSAELKAFLGSVPSEGGE